MTDPSRDTNTVDADGLSTAGVDGSLGPPNPDVVGVVARPAPNRVGRYRVEHRVGRGAMGDVYAARDDELGRRVAIKLVRADKVSSRARQRLLDEAAALARLSHPNVVDVFDVGTEGSHVYVAMGFVEGPTLGAWNAERSKTREAILDAYAAAGHGLQAVHDAGLVHRDFKPSNVLVGVDGIVRLSDFGLAREPTENGGHGAGTAAYMAPEQEAGAATARSDQYSFCVALFEALYGRRPGEGEPASPRSPRPTVDTVLGRGLARAPADRFASMEQLLQALAAARRRAPRRFAVLGCAAVAVVLVAWWAGSPTPAPGRCADVTASIDTAWSPSRAARVRGAFSGLPLGHAASVGERVVQRLDTARSQWITAYETLCAAGLAGSDASRMQACLEQQRRELASLAQVLEAPDAGVVARADRASLGLHPCERPGSAAEPQGVEFDAVRDDLAGLKVADLAGEPAEALERAAAVTQRARALGDDVLTARALFRQGRLLEAAGAYDDAAVVLEDGFHLAFGDGAADVAAESATMLVTVLGIRQRRVQDALRWSRQGEAAVARAEDPRLRGALLTATAGVHARAGNLPAARAGYESALALQQAEFGGSSFVVAATLNNLATVVAGQQSHIRAATLFERAAATFERELGPRHPSVAHALSNLAAAQHDAGDTRAAEATHRRALALVEAASGPTHPSVASVAANLGRVLLEIGNADESRVLLERSVEIRIAALGEEHPEVAYSRVGLGDALLAQGQLTQAQREYSGALAVLTVELGERSPKLSYAHSGLGRVALARGDHAAARRSLRLALELLGPNAPATDRDAVLASLAACDEP